MPNEFDDIEVSGLIRFQLGTGSLVASGLCGLPPNVEPTPLVLGMTTQNYVLPSFGGVGAVVFAVASTGADAVLGGIETTDRGLRPGQIVILVNANAVGSDSWATSSLDAGSSAGNKITLAVTIAAGAALILIYDGTQFIPVFPVTP